LLWCAVLCCGAQTQNPNIYAAGDCIGFPALASTSMEQGARRATPRHGCKEGGA
jgi:NAD(P) transhydrogenase